MRDETAIYLILKKVRARRNELKEVIADKSEEVPFTAEVLSDFRQFMIKEQNFADYFLFLVQICPIG